MESTRDGNGNMAIQQVIPLFFLKFYTLNNGRVTNHFYRLRYIRFEYVNLNTVSMKCQKMEVLGVLPNNCSIEISKMVLKALIRSC